MVRLTQSLRRFTVTSLLVAEGAFAQGEPSAAARDWTKIDQILGRMGNAQPNDVMRYAFPRSDLQVSVGGVAIKPAFALGSWIAFKPMRGSASLVMGDLVLTEDELAPAIRALQAGGVDQTAIHHHLIRETPRVLYMHIHAHGDPETIARAVHTALAATHTPIASPTPSARAAAIDLDTAAIARALGVYGKVNGGVYQVSVPRKESIRENGMVVPASMGLATAINFQPTGGGKAAIVGDFVMRAGEVNKVIRALQAGGIETTSLHSHLLAEEPRLFFMHFWANDDAPKLAATLRRALDELAH